MSYILTFVASDPEAHPLTPVHFPSGDVTWLSPNKAADVAIGAAPGHEALEDIRDALEMEEIDIFLSPAENRRKRLLLADMDSTIVTGETLDELADFAGLKDKIAAITQRAMNGELNFHDAIRERVGLLKDLSEGALHKTLARTKLSPGAKTLVATMKKHGSHCVLVSGGFTFFTEAIAGQAGFDAHHGNTLEIKGSALTGRVIEPILDKHAKVEFLKQHLSALDLQPQDAMTIGDGANDLPMLKTAGLGIGYHPKPNVAKELVNMILYGDLTAALYAQGYSDDMICFED
ncbi:MAG: phosphoserine phosphatase SerB [Alphaproteobacteria bacterium]|nr:phosphoserine phosphatase SerB [Alphaproteobacteria bacterium]